MGDSAIKLLTDLGDRGKSMIKVNDEMGHNWLYQLMANTGIVDFEALLYKVGIILTLHAWA